MVTLGDDEEKDVDELDEEIEELQDKLRDAKSDISSIKRAKQGYEPEPGPRRPPQETRDPDPEEQARQRVQRLERRLESKKDARVQARSWELLQQIKTEAEKLQDRTAERRNEAAEKLRNRSASAAASLLTVSLGIFLVHDLSETARWYLAFSGRLSAAAGLIFVLEYSLKIILRQHVHSVAETLAGTTTDDQLEEAHRKLKSLPRRVESLLQEDLPWVTALLQTGLVLGAGYMFFRGS